MNNKPIKKPINKAINKNLPKLAPGLRSRSIALDILIAVEKDNAYANLALSAAFKKLDLSERDRAFITALVQGTTRNRLSLDESISKLSTRPLAKLPLPLRNVLRMGIFQLQHMSNLPASAVVNTTTELAKSIGHAGIGKFANGLMRNYQRQLEKESPVDGTQLVADSTEDGAMEDAVIISDNDNGNEFRQAVEDTKDDFSSPGVAARLGTKYSMPEWIVERWLKNFGAEETVKLLQFSHSAPDLVLRANDMAITPAALHTILENAYVPFRKGALVDSCVIVERAERNESGQRSASFHGSPQKLPGFAEGMFSVQDEAAAFVSLISKAKPGDVVVDLCAAPGGKTVHMGEMMENRGRIVAVDVSEARLKLVKQNRLRLGLTNIETVVADGRQYQLGSLADIVLVDAPCTGTGVLNRRTDSRYHLKPEDIPQLVSIQRELLANAATMVKPGGVLIYSTCSIEPEENFENIRWFLDNFEEFEGDDLSPFLPPLILSECQPNSNGPACKTNVEMSRLLMLQLLPSRHEVSGFFVARLIRKD
jgi:16S rRNA (cytosine967-C5)-methyltransferase